MAKKTIFSDSISINLVNDLELDQWIRNNLQEAKIKTKSRMLSNMGGFQSEPLLSEEITDLLGKHIVKSMEDFTTKKFKYKLTNIWINENYKYCYNNYHTHPGAHFSGVYYLDTPKNCGDLVFHRTDVTAFLSLNEFFLNQDNCSEFVITPKPGTIIIFPASYGHSVRPNLSDDPRVSISFNFNILG
jgi:uncharacterized protein (TIGR02466 family)